MRASVDEAIAVYSSAIRLQPESAVLHLELGNSYLAADRLQLAKRALERAAQLEPLLFQAAAGLVLIDMKGGHLEEALAKVRSMRAKAPDNPGPMVLEGEVYTALGDHEQPCSPMARLLTMAPRRALL